jgi:hypothetical protein
VVDSLYELKKTQSFDWLVEKCISYQGDDELDNKGDDDGGGGGSGDPKDTRALRRVKGIEAASRCLILINSIISFPESLADRLRLRTEFIQLSMLDVLQLRPKRPVARSRGRPHLQRPARLLGAGPCAPGGAPSSRGCQRDAIYVW